MYNEEKIREFYKQYDGHSFHMAREEPAKYNSWIVPLPEEIRRKWDQEIIDDLFASLWDDDSRVWSRHYRLIELIKRNKNENNIERFLDEMEKMPMLDKRSKIIIIENMAGRDEGHNGGYRLVCQFPNYVDRLNSIMEKIMDFTLEESDRSDDLGWQDITGRYQRAVMSLRVTASSQSVSCLSPERDDKMKL